MPSAQAFTPDLLRRRLLVGLGACSALLALPMPLQALSEADTAELVRWLAEKTGLDQEQVRNTLSHAQFRDRIIELMTTPHESKPYNDYRPLFVTDKLQQQGAEYLIANKDVFEQAYKKYGVEAEMIAAILGMETRYGRHRGKIPVLDSLYTLSTGYPRRAEFFRNELAEFLLMCREEGLDPTLVLGSYAGAMGTTQLLPSSFRKYAVDADGDGKRDIWDSTPDIIASVANYFREYGWVSGRPLALKLSDRNPALNRQSELGLTSWLKLSDLRQHLPELDKRWRDDDQVSIIELVTNDGGQLVLIHYNYYVITRWNRSYNYAMAATEVAAMLGCSTCAVS